MNIEQIKVSVITPTHNDEKYIFDTIQSVLSQTHFCLELIIVDDFSNDKTIEIVKSFNDKRIRLIRNSCNHGAAFSRNLAIRESTGDYVAFLDGDDLWKKDKLEQQLNFMISNNYLFSCTNYEIIDDDGTKIGKYVVSPKKISHKKFLKTSYVGCLTVMYRKDLIPDLQIPDNIYKRNDYAMWLKISELSDCYNLPMILSYYRKRNNSISSGKKIHLFKYHISLYKILYNYSNFKAFVFSVRNAFYYAIKILKYSKKIGNKNA